MNKITEIFEQLKEDIHSGKINDAKKDTLSKYASALCHSQAFSFFGNNQYPQICELVRTNLLRSHIDSLQSHITDLDSKNTFLQKLVIALAGAALLGTAVQIFITLRSDARTEQYYLQDSSLKKQPVASIQKNIATLKEPSTKKEPSLSNLNSKKPR